ncbi:MAG: 4'-phosphopantetheinyl transferase superfamily protein [bacterium]|nr:4'-phosphopantetheinyl transferase superfamily protein [bacterium]MDZ4299411.1 4'-phosphopantetheinyl transferase superfamily protein [Candidatus Sungbacteria bacterium]
MFLILNVSFIIFLMRVGIDLVAVKKFLKVKKTDYWRWSHVFTVNEWAYAFRDVHRAEHLAGMFAAKEAAMKASGRMGVEYLKFFEVRHTARGAPSLRRAGYRVSISHDRTYAIAVVLVE